MSPAIDPRPGPAQIYRPTTLVKDANERIRLRAASISIAVGIALLGIKFLAYHLTGSVAVLSDALESVVNVVAAASALGVLKYAGRPADEDHPYGHGKVEFFSSAFEGGLIAFAAVLIVYTAIQSFFFAAPLHQLDLGLAITLGAGFANAALGWFLVRTGNRVRSLTLVADGQHVLSDFWTSLGVIVGLVLVRITGIQWLDPLVAAIVGVNLAWTGIRLVRVAAAGLLDAVDPKILEKLAMAFNANATPGIIHVHRLRAIRYGRFVHVDAHLVVPENWSVGQAHDAAEAFSHRVMESCAIEGEIAFHLDPCRQSFCPSCDVVDCPIRIAPLEARPGLTVEELVGPDQVTGDPRD
ncbi:MAG: cation transporter [Planctomycetes bacterium]|nr:cation transporter [Planctomycetota bacterium]MBI3846049.1 cation transporter [Planctomycetota bacterium]